MNGFTFASCILLGIKVSTANLFSRLHYLVAVSRVWNTPSRLPTRLEIQYWWPEFHSWSPAGNLSWGLSHSKKMINIWNHEDICQQVSYMYFSSRWYFLIKSETNLPVKIPPQQLLSIELNVSKSPWCFQLKYATVRYVCVIILYPHIHSCGLVRATRRVDSCLCFVFHGNYRKKMEC